MKPPRGTTKVEKGQLWIFQNHWRRAELVKCLTCGKEFPAPIGENRKFCSQACAGSGPPREVTKACEICGENFTLMSSRARHRKTCGKERCRFLLASRASKERSAARGRVQR